MNEFYTRNVLEAALLAAGKPLTIAELGQLFDENNRPQVDAIRAGLDGLAAEYSNRALEVKETAAGFRIQVRREFASEISRLWPERPARYSRALLETLALIAYRQPITRAEIEAVRGVAVNPNIVKTVIERNWVRVVGHRDVPGRPELLGTTREFLDYFGLRSLDELPPLAELKAMGDYNLQLELPNAGALGVEGEGGSAAVALLGSEVAGEGGVGEAVADAASGELAGGVGEAVADGANVAGDELAGGVGETVSDGARGESVESADGADPGTASGDVAGDAGVLEATFVDATVVDVDASSDASADAEPDPQAVGGDSSRGDDDFTPHADAGSNRADADAAHDAVAETESSHDTHGLHDEPTHEAVSTADADDLEADRTLSSGDVSEHAADSDDSDATEPAITNATPDALEDAADDDADEDELSADGHGSRELVAAPRDIDD